MEYSPTLDRIDSAKNRLMDALRSAEGECNKAELAALGTIIGKLEALQNRLRQKARRAKS